MSKWRNYIDAAQRVLARFGAAGARGRQLMLENRGALQRLAALIPIP